MKALIQRVTHARVEVAGEEVGAIGRGLLVLLGVEKHDDEHSSERMMRRLLDYRVFPDSDGRMNCSVADIDGGVLLVPQFTLAADTRKGLRPSFSSAAPPAIAEALYDHALAWLRSHHEKVASGRFAADMQISLCNDGPVTFLLEQ